MSVGTSQSQFCNGLRGFPAPHGNQALVEAGVLAAEVRQAQGGSLAPGAPRPARPQPAPQCHTNSLVHPLHAVSHPRYAAVQRGRVARVHHLTNGNTDYKGVLRF